MDESRFQGLSSPETFRIRYSSILEKISEAAAKSLRGPSEIGVMAVTKFHPLASILVAYEAGIRRFGESRVQEAQEKAAGFRGRCLDASLEMIGHVQSNKAKKAVALFDCIQSVDSLDLLVELEKGAISAGKSLGVLFELHTAEDSKSGFRDRDALFRACAFMSHPERKGALIPFGLMTIAPLTREERTVHSAFASCREAFLDIKSQFGFPSFTTLSMGMSEDYIAAVEEGSTLVRIGTALFGARTA